MPGGITSVIAGLGNPGDKYLLTPHNIGWMAVSALANTAQLTFQTHKKKLFLHQTGVIENKSVLLLKPLTYMNLSGRAVREALNYYDISLDGLLVIHDDLDLPFLRMRFQKDRGPAGHNGLKSINEELKTQNYVRLKIGIANPDGPPRDVLKTFTNKEQELLPKFLASCTEAVRYFLRQGLAKAASRWNAL